MISENIAHIRRKIDEACLRSGRKPSEVTLVAVTKTFPAGQIRAAYQLGVEDIGENYVQESLEKREQLKDIPVRWHFIGHLQSNKARQIAGWVTLIHSLESLSLAKELDRQAEKLGRSPEVLVEVNTTGESSKYGIAPEQTVSFVRSLSAFSGLNVLGLMTIGPFLPDPEMSRPMFRKLRELKEQVAALGQTNVSMKHLSMGMTGDFEVAIEEGATLVRIGTAIFGSRKKPT